MIKRMMLSTVDNPFNPFTNFDEWLACDIQKGHNSCCLLARFAPGSEEISEELDAIVTNEAIFRIVNMNPSLFVAVADPKAGSTDSGGPNQE